MLFGIGKLEIIFFLLFLQVHSALAEDIVLPKVLVEKSGDIEITELMPNPNDGELEWVEIFNSSSSKISVVDWYIDDIEEGSTPQKISFDIESDSYLSLVFTSNKLNNMGTDSVRILDNLKNVVASVSYTDSIKGKSIQKIGDSWIYGDPSKGQENINSEPDASPESIYIDPSDVLISEFMPCPKANYSEWVEIFNNNAASVSIIDWEVDDVEGGSAPQKFSAMVEAQSYYVITLSSGKLNNTGGDTVRLINSSGVLVDSVSYPSCETDVSFARDSGNWRKTQTSTQGSPNKIVYEESDDSENSEDEENDEEEDLDREEIESAKESSEESIKDEITTNPDVTKVNDSKYGAVLGVSSRPDINRKIPRLDYEKEKHGLNFGKFNPDINYKQESKINVIINWLFNGVKRLFKKSQETF